MKIQQGVRLYALLGFMISTTDQFTRADVRSHNFFSSLSEFSEGTNELTNFIDENILQYELKLAKLRYLRETLVTTSTNFRNAQTKLLKSHNVDQAIVQHPVHLFILANNINRIQQELSQPSDDSKLAIFELDDIFEKVSLPRYDTLIKLGEAILRLQTFYKLNIDDLIKGKLVKENDTIKIDADDLDLIADTGFHMGPSECHELGKLAYDLMDNPLAIGWFEKALQLINKTEDIEGRVGNAGLHQDVEGESLIDDILDYLAFAAYRDGQIYYAANVTRLWLAREPGHERAMENLEFYEEELTRARSVDKSDDTKKEEDESDTQPNLYSPDQEFSASRFRLNQDAILRDLCTRIHAHNDLVCHTEVRLENYFNGPQLKIETLNKDPLIVRIHDMITDREAKHLRRIATPNLRRSTIQSQMGAVSSDFRIAKTAWMSSESDLVVKNIEQRIREITKLDLNDSEELQIVNYSFGGYYGPHLDAARRTISNGNNDSCLTKNDRLATVLIYLNKVYAGGATAFLKLNLTVLPVKNSAVIWYNFKQDTSVDHRTLHSGCPVLLGTKWIATKWPREEANAFQRPCKLTR